MNRNHMAVLERSKSIALEIIKANDRVKDPNFLAIEIQLIVQKALGEAYIAGMDDAFNGAIDAMKKATSA